RERDRPPARLPAVAHQVLPAVVAANSCRCYSGRVRLTLLFCAAAALLHAQSTPEGLEPSWSVAVILEEIGKDAAPLLPVLDKMDPKAWVAKGASETYAAQWQSSRDQARVVADAARTLAKNPERLAPALELWFRIEGLDRMLASVQEGARKYQSVQSAQQ